jgi:hypothetical protein
MIDRLFAGALLTLMVFVAVSASAADVSTEGVGEY